MSFKFDIIKDTLKAFLFTSLAVFLYYSFYSISNGTLWIAILSSLVRSFVTVLVLYIIEKACDDNIYTGGAFLLYSCVIYNQISVIKYSVDSFYEGSIASISTRLFGSLFIDFVIIFTSIIFYVYHRHRVKISYSNMNLKRLNVSFFVVYPMVFLYIILNVYYTHNTGNILNTDVSRTFRTFTTLFTYLVYALIIVYIKKEEDKFKFSSFIPLILVLIVNFYLTMVTGKKNIFIVLGVVVICGLLITKKIKFKYVKYIAFSSALLLQFVQISSEAFSSRTWYNTNYLLQYHAYRFDLSDLPMTIALRYNNIENPFSIITESFEYSIPSFLVPNKNLELNQYVNSMESVGLNGDFDFNDTFFSMGAQVGGFIGIISIFIIIMLFFEWMSWGLLNFKNGLCINVVLIPYFATSESDWSMFLYQTRDLIIFILFSYLLFYLILKQEELRSNQHDIFNCS